MDKDYAYLPGHPRSPRLECHPRQSIVTCRYLILFQYAWRRGHRPCAKSQVQIEKGLPRVSQGKRRHVRFLTPATAGWPICSSWVLTGMRGEIWLGDGRAALAPDKKAYLPATDETQNRCKLISMGLCACAARGCIQSPTFYDRWWN